MRTPKDYEKWVELYDKLQYSNAQDVDVVWTDNLYDINYLKRNDRYLYDSLHATKDIMSYDCTDPISLVVKNHRK